MRSLLTPLRGRTQSPESKEPPCVSSAVHCERSPDGTKIAFRSDRDGNREIYVMNADGSGQTRLTTNEASDRDPAWAPDGTKLAFASDRDGNDEIYVMDTDGSDQTRRTNNAAIDQQPAWSPDGTKIAFMSSRDGNFEIYVMDADGSDQTRLTTASGAADAEPDWQPILNGLLCPIDSFGGNDGKPDCTLFSGGNPSVGSVWRPDPRGEPHIWRVRVYSGPGGNRTRTEIDVFCGPGPAGFTAREAPGGTIVGHCWSRGPGPASTDRRR